MDPTDNSNENSTQQLSNTSIKEDDDEVMLLNASTTVDKNTERGLKIFQKMLELNSVLGSRGYVFGRERSESLNLNDETVTILHYPFEPASIPPGEDPLTYRKAFSDAKVYLVGTSHYTSAKSQQDVLSTIKQTQPDLVMVDLCPSRIAMLVADEQTLLREAGSLNFEKILTVIREIGLIQGLLQVLLFSHQADATRHLGVAPGGEARAACTGLKEVLNCRLVLGDRPIQITFKRLASLGFFEKMRIICYFLTNPMTREEVERLKNKEALEKEMKETAEKLPQYSRILIDERDQYMTSALHTILQKSTAEKLNACRKTGARFEPVVVVAVVGTYHVSGIVDNWNKHIDSMPLVAIPQPSKEAVVFNIVFKLTELACLCYVVFRIGRFAYRKVSSSVGTGTVSSPTHSAGSPQDLVNNSEKIRTQRNTRSKFLPNSTAISKKDSSSGGSKVGGNRNYSSATEVRPSSTNFPAAVGQQPFGIFPIVDPSSFAENQPKSLPVREFVEQTAWHKAIEVAERYKNSKNAFNAAIVCDTVISLDGSIIGKPLDSNDAFETLKKFNGRKHSVFSGVCLINSQFQEQVFSVKTEVEFGQMRESMLQAYVETGEPLGRAGSYAIQCKGAALIKSIQVCYNNVVGLPIHELAKRLSIILRK